MEIKLLEEDYKKYINETNKQIIKFYKDRFTTLFESLNASAFITTLDGKIIESNFKTCDILGYNFEEIRNVNLKTIFTNPDEWSQFCEEISSRGGLNFETTCRKKDGSIFPVYINTSLFIQNEIPSILFLIWDISERKSAEEKLISSEERYRTIFENSAVAIMLTDQNERIVSWNKYAETMLKMEKDDLYLRPVQSLYPDEEWELIRTENIRKKGMQHHLETKMIDKNGKIVDIDISLTILKNMKDEVIGSIGVFRDISLRIEVEKKLDAAYNELLEVNRDLEYKVLDRTKEIKKLLKQKDEFIYQLGHDLKTPLTPLCALLPVVLEKVEDSQSKKYLEVSIHNVKYIKNLVEKTLKLALLNSNSFELEIEEIIPWEIIDRVINNRIDNVNAKNITVENMVDKAIKINADKLRFEELMDNIIGNAMKFTPENGMISIYSELVNKKIRFSVRDTGCGMTLEQYEKIFVEFYKADKSRHEINSSGLGLSICKRIVEKHGGEIWVESPGPGKGSTFYFTFDST